MICLSLLFNVTSFAHLIHLLKRANQLICILGSVYDAFSVPVLYHYIAIRYSRFAIMIRYHDSRFVIALERCSRPEGDVYL